MAVSLVVDVSGFDSQSVQGGPERGTRHHPRYRNMAQLVAHLLWEQGVAGSSPAIPTRLKTARWEISSVGQSIRFTSERSLVRAQYLLPERRVLPPTTNGCGAASLIVINMKNIFYILGLILVVSGLTSCSPYYYNSTNRSAVYTNDGKFSHVRYSGVGNSYRNGIRTKYARTPRKQCQRDW